MRIVTAMVLLWIFAFASAPCRAADAPASASPAARADASNKAAEDAASAETKAYRDYQAATLSSLARGTSPRDWAIARLLGASLFANAQKPDQKFADQTPQAAVAWPDDVLVQWMTLRAAAKASAEQKNALQALERLESDNAAVWLWELDRANAGADQSAIEDALKRMAASRRYNDHRADLLRLLVDVHQRYPMPPESYANPLAASVKDVAPYMFAAVETSALLQEPYQVLNTLCRIDPVSGKNVSHAEQCEPIGRMLALHSGTLIGSRIGFALLRSSHTFGDQDVRSARELDWITQQYTAAQGEVMDGADAPNPDPGRVAQIADVMRRQVADQIETGSEIEAIRQALVRAGKSLKPPGDWIDNRSPFSEAALRADEDGKVRERQAARTTPANRNAAPVPAH